MTLGTDHSAFFKKWSSRTLLRLLGAGLALCIAGIQLFHGQGLAHHATLSRIDAVLYDLRFQLLPPVREAVIPIVIVDIDEASLQQEGRWPWSRRKIARLITTLQAQGAALIGFDMVFSEPETNPAELLLQQPDLPASVRESLQSLAIQDDADAALAEALGTNSVLGYFFHADGASVGSLPPAFLELEPGKARALSLRNMPDFTSNLDLLSMFALASGFVVAVPDADGVVRRMPLVMLHDQGLYASLMLEVTRLALGAPWIRLDTAALDDREVVTGVRIGPDFRVPLDEHGNMLIPYKGVARSYPTLSASALLSSNDVHVDLSVLEGAIVLIGTSALGLSDLRTVPLHTGFPGVEVHANGIDTLLQAAMFEAQARQDEARHGWLALNPEDRSPLYHRPDWEPGASLLLLCLTGIILVLWLPGRSPLRMLSIASGWLLLVVVVNGLLWHWWHLAFPLALQVLMVFILATLNIAGGYWVANRQKHQIQDLFGAYVPAHYVEQMLNQPASVSLEGENREMTVLFADVRNFTAMSENLSASELKSLLNRYLSAITEVIFAHHGTIDKYVGDMVMAFWNAPLDDPDHAKHAVQAALAMQQRMALLRQAFTADGLPQLHIGIGVHTGPMNVGDMGSTYRRAYTVLGDAVNLASRLEGLTAFYDVPILVSHDTREAASDVIYRPIDKVRVKGRQQPLEISQPLEASTMLNDQFQQAYAEYEQALASYQNQCWAQAHRLFNSLTLRYPDTKLYTIYRERILAIQKGSLVPDRDGVFDHASK